MRKNSFLTIITAITVIAIITFACKKSSTTNTSSVKYFSTAKTILNTYCGSTCHGNGGQAPDLTDSATIVANSAKIKDRITRAAGATGVMPPNGSTPLTAGAKDTLIRWVDAGGKGNN